MLFLAEERNKTDEESDKLHSQFLDKEIELAAFVQKFKKLRSLYHRRAMTHLAAKSSPMSWKLQKRVHGYGDFSPVNFSRCFVWLFARTDLYLYLNTYYLFPVGFRRWDVIKSHAFISTSLKTNPRCMIMFLLHSLGCCCFYLITFFVHLSLLHCRW